MTITIKNDRAIALAAGVQALAERLPMLEVDALNKAFESYIVRAFVDGEKPIGMLLERGAEVHVAIIPEYRGRWLSRRLIREVLGSVIARCGYVETSVMPNNRAGILFVEALGFEPWGVKNPATRKAFDAIPIYRKVTL